MIPDALIYQTNVVLTGPQKHVGPFGTLWGPLGPYRPYRAQLVTSLGGKTTQRSFLIRAKLCFYRLVKLVSFLIRG